MSEHDIPGWLTRQAMIYDKIFTDPQKPVLSVRIGGCTFEVAFDRMDSFDGRSPRYYYRMYGAEGPIKEPILYGDDIRGGAGEEVNLPSALETWLTSMEAWQEASHEGSENWDLFDNDHRHSLDWDELFILLREHVVGYPS